MVLCTCNSCRTTPNWNLKARGIHVQSGAGLFPFFQGVELWHRSAPCSFPSNKLGVNELTDLSVHSATPMSTQLKQLPGPTGGALLGTLLGIDGGERLKTRDPSFPDLGQLGMDRTRHPEMAIL